MATPAQVWGFAIGAGTAADVMSDAAPLANELHLVHGLNASAPLVVTDASRAAGPVVSQSLDATGGIVTVARL